MSISSYIKADLNSRLRSGRKLPAPLTLQSLAEHYGVSVTPVRAAVAELIDEGILKKGANRRLSPHDGQQPLHQGARAPSPPPPPRDVFQIISHDLVKLSLEGEPVYLREEATAEKYGISRSAIRNLFHRLAGYGVLEHFPRCGWRLRPFRQEDLQAFLEVREVLELKALKLARGRLQKDELRKFLDRNKMPETADEALRIDNSLHAYIIDRSRNPYIKDFMQRHGGYYQLLFQWESQDRETSIETIRQHREILTALIQGDWRTARKALSHHIRGNHPTLNRMVSSSHSKSPQDEKSNGQGGRKNPGLLATR